MSCAVKQPPSPEDVVTDTIPPSQEGHDSYPIELSLQPENASQQEEDMPVPPAKKL